MFEINDDICQVCVYLKWKEMNEKFVQVFIN